MRDKTDVYLSWRGVVRLVVCKCTRLQIAFWYDCYLSGLRLALDPDFEVSDQLFELMMNSDRLSCYVSMNKLKYDDGII
jgi:hypothetical protein